MVFLESYGSVETLSSSSQTTSIPIVINHRQKVSIHHRSRLLSAAVIIITFLVLCCVTLLILSDSSSIFTIWNHSKSHAVTATLLSTTKSSTTTSSIDSKSSGIPQNDYPVEPSPALPQFFETTLEWNKEEEKDDGSFYYIGYLEFCSNGKGQFFYRAVTITTTTTPCIADRNNSTTATTTASNNSPLIRMFPQTYYKLVLINRSHQPTNFHTHGLHVSGVGSVDDITRNVDPGNCLVYHYRIKDDADVGTFWYHSHRHPLAANQVSGGAYGMLIVDESPKTMENYYPRHLQRFFSRKNEVLLQYNSVILDKTKTPIVRTNLINGKKQDDDGNEVPIELILNPNEYYYFRISAVAISDPINYMEFIPKHSCGEVRVMAYDGVYRSTLPHSESIHRHMLTSSSRVDLAVQCQRDATIVFHQGTVEDGSNLVTIKVWNNNTTNNSSSKKEEQDGNDENQQQQQQQQDQVLSSPFWDAKKKTSWNPRRPYYMPNFIAMKNEFWKFDYWNVTMNEAVKDEKGGVVKEVSINEIQWDPAIAIRDFQLNQLVEWNLINTQAHPFHIHINRMQVVQEGGCGYRYEAGEYYDTIASKSPSCKIRMQFWDFAGRIVAHCHKLKHEDQGMMVWIDVVGGPEHGVKGTSQVQCSSIMN